MKMTFKFFPFLILSMSLLTCSSSEQESGSGGSTDLVDPSSGSSDLPLVEELTVETEPSYSDSIWKLVTKELTMCPSVNSKNIDNKNWSSCDHHDGLRLYVVQYVQDDIAITEKYLTKEDQLIYAVEAEKRTAAMRDDEATYWNCEYVIQADRVVDHMSLGMGKTEDDSFDLQDIITLWNSRKAVFSELEQ